MKMTKKIRTLSLLFAVIFAMPLVTKAQTADIPTSPDSAISVSGSGADLTTGVPNYPDSLYIECTAGPEDCSTLLSTSTPYTILSYAVSDLTESGSGSGNFSCDGNVLPLREYSAKYDGIMLLVSKGSCPRFGARYFSFLYLFRSL